MKAPFPYFGGKSRIASVVWDYLGNPRNYVEPFFGSGAVLLNRPLEHFHQSRIETVNDLDGYLCNFWRAIQSEPETVAKAATRPVSEADLIAWNTRLKTRRPEFTKQLFDDPEFYDATLAGTWVWGISGWLGAGWAERNVSYQMPSIGKSSSGVTQTYPYALEGLITQGNAPNLETWFRQLQGRLLRVRVVCGEWDRVLSPSVTTEHGETAFFLDPPYDGGNVDPYGVGVTTGIAADVLEWAKLNTENFKIALCGYDGEHDCLGELGWQCHKWQANGGFGNSATGTGKSNRERERIWFSPKCKSSQMSIFDIAA